MGHYNSQTSSLSPTFSAYTNSSKV